MTSADPLREVALIAIEQGTRGGKVWALTLECGHEVRQHVRTRPGRGGQEPLPAPRSARCVLCGAGFDPRPVQMEERHRAPQF